MFDLTGISSEVGLKDSLTKPFSLIGALIPLLTVIGGLILLFMLISGGFQIMTAIENPDQAEEGKKKITAAIIGFLILFASFWIAQALQIIFGINLTGS